VAAAGDEPARGAGGRRGRRARISRSGDFDAVYRRGRSASNRHLVLHAFHRHDPAAASGPAPGAPARLGLSVSKRVGNAVERNRVKRVLREQFARLAPGLPADHDFVVVARPGVAAYREEKGSAALGARLEELAARLTANGAAA